MTLGLIATEVCDRKGSAEQADFFACKKFLERLGKTTKYK
jgi:hypothetical protein